MEGQMIRVPTKELDLNYVELRDLGYHTNFPGKSDTFICFPYHLISNCTLGSMLNPDRIAAGGKPLFSLRVMPWADDASGNQSKQYNPHINLCTQNLSIPHEKLKHQYFVRFCSTSQHASSGEQFRPFIEAWYSEIFYSWLAGAEAICSGHDNESI
jgi:hypothetical protein